ncbi:oxygen-independent coproporphyrinogen III oxidase [Psychrosphaera ytuae]|uniref:Coproporphyrinogen-III oxidase n=1 Tax=Psychrosphaera ytuae TaxID=2820710 RepID=A0A975HIR1_9GAMM|nr:oxygen-independent coproporphyrinogen III oxidase [Psychrosphaera ytuae]QTH64512.1 oxygen-independent coproporphyrinogen III oxidase [Psychrosphaera ytuae]
MTVNKLSALFDNDMLKKYDSRGPRYTSYPTALEFEESFENDEFEACIKSSINRDLSLYIHIPFCHSLCYYCGCNKIVTRHPEKADRYLDMLIQEMAYRASQLKDREVSQIHLGGGTPSFLSEAQISRLMLWVRRLFKIKQRTEVSIEIDPRNLDLNYVDHLANEGFNRMSIGVQDITAKVQIAINRQQSSGFIKQLIERAHLVGFDSVNIDLIYGLPHQTEQSFAESLKVINGFNADRISLFSYAHLPDRFAAQRKIKDTWLPSAAAKLGLMQMAMAHFLATGYDMIGMDHFAKPTDELAIAMRSGQLHRNFQGYTTQGDTDLLGLGVSAISSLGHCYSQNHKSLRDYDTAIAEQGHAIEKGKVLSEDDMVRRYVIAELMCNLNLSKPKVNEYFEVDFDQYFADSIKVLQPLIKDGLVNNDLTHLSVAPEARLIIRTVCMAFDAYLPEAAQARYSKVI